MALAEQYLTILAAHFHYVRFCSRWVTQELVVSGDDCGARPLGISVDKAGRTAVPQRSESERVGKQ